MSETFKHNCLGCGHGLLAKVAIDDPGVDILYVDSEYNGAEHCTFCGYQYTFSDLAKLEKEVAQYNAIDEKEIRPTQAGYENDVISKLASPTIDELTGSD